MGRGGRRDVVGTRVAVEEEPVEVRECRQLIVQNVLVCLVQLEPFPSAQQTPVLEHVEGLRVQCPVRSLPWSVRSAWHLYEAVVEAQVVSQGVLWRWKGQWLLGRHSGYPGDLPASAGCSCGSRESGP